MKSPVVCCQTYRPQVPISCQFFHFCYFLISVGFFLVGSYLLLSFSAFVNIFGTRVNRKSVLSLGHFCYLSFFYFNFGWIKGYINALFLMGWQVSSGHTGLVLDHFRFSLYFLIEPIWRKQKTVQQYSISQLACVFMLQTDVCRYVKCNNCIVSIGAC